jgi:hypothetical protein
VSALNPERRERLERLADLASRMSWPAGKVGRDWCISSLSIHVYAFDSWRDQRPVVIGVDANFQELLVTCVEDVRALLQALDELEGRQVSGVP